MFLQTGLLYPLELAWTRIAADTAAKNDRRLYTGLLHCLQQTYHAEGPRGAWWHSSRACNTSGGAAQPKHDCRTKHIDACGPQHSLCSHLKGVMCTKG